MNYKRIKFNLSWFQKITEIWLQFQFLLSIELIEIKLDVQF